VSDTAFGEAEEVETGDVIADDERRRYENDSASNDEKDFRS
jgi:hypothetical protein